MATTYIEVVNEILTELNEVNLTDVTFPSAVNIQNHVKALVNRAYFDICTEHYRWPFLAENTSSEPFLGNTYIETVAGQRWYLLNPDRTDKDDDYAFVDWDRFYLTTMGVDGESVPYKNNRLKYIDIDYWMKHFRAREDDDLSSENPQYGRPLRTLRNPDNIRFGLSPIPDQVYRIYFYAYKQPTKLELATDEFVIPDKFISTLIARARYYAWQIKENPQQASLAIEDYKKGIRRMREVLIEDQPDFISDDRIRFLY